MAHSDRRIPREATAGDHASPRRLRWAVFRQTLELMYEAAFDSWPRNSVNPARLKRIARVLMNPLRTGWPDEGRWIVQRPQLKRLLGRIGNARIVLNAGSGEGLFSPLLLKLPGVQRNGLRIAFASPHSNRPKTTDRSCIPDRYPSARPCLRPHPLHRGPRTYRQRRGGAQRTAEGARTGWLVVDHGAHATCGV